MSLESLRCEIILGYRRSVNKIWREGYGPVFRQHLLLKDSCAQNASFRHDASLDNVCLAYPRSIQNFFARIDLTCTGLKPVSDAVRQKQWPYACESFLEYHRSQICSLKPYAEWSGIAPESMGETDDSAITRAELLLNHTFTFQSMSSQVPVTPFGGLDWSYSGICDDQEWAWFLNRHNHLLDLLTAYRATQEEKFVRCINHHIIDWTQFSVSPKGANSRTQWRGLEVAFRVMNWVWVYEELRHVPAFSPTARMMMMMSLTDHGRYLRRMHAWGANWITREMGALATLSLGWPEFRSSPDWLDYAINRMVWESRDQIYQDGAQKELTSHYHWLTLQDFQNFSNCLNEAGKIIPVNLKAQLERMWNYSAYSIRPDGTSPLNNDSDRQLFAPKIQQAGIAYQRPDWTYIATCGQAGASPPLPSIAFPWAGQLIMRSDWDDKAHWGFFDFGPLGIFYHTHRDKLHLSISAYGRDLLVDGGRYRYVRDPFWHYFRGSHSHNVVLIEGKGQKPGASLTCTPLLAQYAITPSCDFAEGTVTQGFEKLKGQAIHQRAVTYIRGQFWVVTDHIYTDRPREISVLWHFHPDCTVVSMGNCVQSTDADVGNLKIQPVSSLHWSVQLVRGQENPVQGWWSREYNRKEPATTAIYSTTIEQTTTFGWVLWPSQGPPPPLKIEQTPSPTGTFIMTLYTPQPITIAVRLNDNKLLLLPNGQQLKGRCCVLKPEQPPEVVLGEII